jgi:hypothetical protein
MSQTTTAPDGGRAETTPRSVSRASCSPVSTRVRTPQRRSRRRMNSAPLAASRTALVATASGVEASSSPARFA